MSKINQIIQKARECLGTPYLYGGESFKEGGFDCSGLCYYVYSECGVKIGRTTYDQIKLGTKIANKSDLKAGDLIFTNFSKGQPQHVMLYAGNGKVIEAKRTGTKISEHSNWEWEGQARRIINNSIESTQVSNENIFYRVVCGSYNSKSHAQEMQDKLKKAGFDSFLVTFNK